MNQLEVLVHFEGRQNWCALVRASNFEKIMVLDVIRIALAKYNAVFHASVTIPQIRVRTILDINRPDIPLDSPELEEVKSSDCEIVVILPDYEDWERELQEEQKAIFKTKKKEILKMAQTFMAAGYYSDARDLMVKSGGVPADSVLERMYKGCYEEMNGMIPDNVKFVDPKCENRIEVDPRQLGMSDKVFGVKRSVADVRDDLLDFSRVDERKTPEDILLLAKTNPKMAFSLALRYPSLFNALPKLCEANEECVNYFMGLIVKMHVHPKDCLVLAEIFQKAGNINIALELLIIYQDIDMDANIIRFILWFLLVDNRLARLQSMLRSWLFKGGYRRIMSNSSMWFDQTIRNVKSPRKVETRALPLAKPLVTDQSQVEETPDTQMVPIVEIAALYCFMAGAFQSFCEFRNILAPVIGVVLSDGKTMPITRTFLYACSAYERIKENGPIGDKVVAIGDETSMLLAHQATKDQGTIVAYPIPALMIASLVFGEENTAKSIFWNRIEEISGYETLILCIGSNDLVTTVPKWLRMDKNAVFEDVFEAMINGLAGVIHKIKEMHPDIEVVVHHLFYNESTPQCITRLFNTMLYELLPDDIGLLQIDANIAELLEYTRVGGKEDRYGQQLQNALESLQNGSEDEN